MSQENAAISAKTELKKAIKAGKNECATLATIINQIIDQALWEYLTLPGESAADKLHNLITLPYDQGGLNTEIHEVDALLSISPSTQRKFRTIVHAAKQGERNDLRPQPKSDKVEAKLSPAKKSKKPSSSQLATDRAAGRAAEALPQIDKLLDEGLISKNSAAKVGQKLKDPKNPTSQDRKVIENRRAVERKLEQILPDPLPEDPKERKELSRKVKEIVEETTGKKSHPRIILSARPEEAAKNIAKAVNSIDYLQQLIVAIELEIEDLQALTPSKSAKQEQDNSVPMAA